MVKIKVTPNYETTVVDKLVKEVITETLKSLELEETSISLKTEAIYNKLSKRASIEPYLRNEIVKREKFTVWSRRKEYQERMERINNIPLGKLPPVDDRIVKTICSNLSIDYTLLRKDFRQTDYIDARKILSHIFRKYMGYNLTKIGVILGKHHSTVVVALIKHSDLMTSDKSYRRKFFKTLETVQEKLSDIIDISNIEPYYLQQLETNK